MSKSRNPVVWIIKEQMTRNEVGSVPMDYSPAMRFGDLEFITQHDMPLYGWKSSSVYQHWESSVLEFVRRYVTATDYVITTGQPIAMFAVGYALGKAGKCPRFLVWRREENAYWAVDFDDEFLISEFDGK